MIDSNRIALTALQQSAEAMGESDGSLSKGLDHLQGKVSDLFADVEVQLRCEDAKWADTANKEIDSVEATVSRFRPAQDYIAEIDRLQSNSK